MRLGGAIESVGFVVAGAIRGGNGDASARGDGDRKQVTDAVPCAVTESDR